METAFLAREGANSVLNEPRQGERLQRAHQDPRARTRLPDGFSGLDTSSEDFRNALTFTAVGWACSFVLLLLPILVTNPNPIWELESHNLILPTSASLLGFLLTGIVYTVARRTRAWATPKMIAAVVVSVLAVAAVLSVVDARLYGVVARAFSPFLNAEPNLTNLFVVNFVGFTWLFGMFGAIYVMQITGSAMRARERELARTALEGSRETQSRQAFLLELGDALRRRTVATDILHEAVQALGRHLAANRVGYAEIDAGADVLTVDVEWGDGSLSAIRGRYPLAAFGQCHVAALTRGETARIDDVDDSPHVDDANRPALRAMGIEAGVTVPLVRDGELVALLSVHQGEPRAWKATEVHLIEEVAERTWTTVERARAEADLAASQEALYQSEKLTALGSLLAGVSHELNNPLSVVVAQSVMMEEDAAGSKLATRAVKIRGAAERCAKIVQTFLAMARQKPPTRGRVDVNSVVRGALDLTAYGLRSTGVEVACDLASDLPTLEADADQLHQVLANLVVNAQQALQEVSHRRHLSIVTRRGRQPGTIQVEVADNGPGVPEEIRRRVLEPFFTTKPPGSGTGLGLSFSHGVIEAHGGTLELLETREGAAFRVTLPAPGTDASSKDVDNASPPTAGDHGRGDALVVDDEAEIADTLAEILEGQGYCVWIAGDGAEAKRQLATRDFDLILSDLRMPGIDGPALHAWMKAKRPHLLDRLGFVTGDTMGPGAVRFLAESGRLSLEKPFTPQAVRDLVGRVRAKVDAA